MDCRLPNSNHLGFRVLYVTLVLLALTPALLWAWHKQHLKPPYPQGRCFADNNLMFRNDASGEQQSSGSVVFWIDAGSIQLDTRVAIGGKVEHLWHEIQFDKEFQEGHDLRLRVRANQSKQNSDQPLPAWLGPLPSPGSALNLSFEPLGANSYLAFMGSQMTFMCHEGNA